MRRMQVGMVAVLGLLVAVALVRGAEEPGKFPGQVHRIVKAGTHTVSSGDLIEIAVASNPSTGPNNPAANLKVEVDEFDVVKKVGVYFAPPVKPMPGAPGELRAYLVAHGPGDAKVVVTPISGQGQLGRPLKFLIKVGKG